MGTVPASTVARTMRRVSDILASLPMRTPWGQREEVGAHIVRDFQRYGIGLRRYGIIADRYGIAVDRYGIAAARYGIGGLTDATPPSCLCHSHSAKRTCVVKIHVRSASRTSLHRSRNGHSSKQFHVELSPIHRVAVCTSSQLQRHRCRFKSGRAAADTCSCGAGLHRHGVSKGTSCSKSRRSGHREPVSL